jgi:hypothetical protein
MLATRNDAYLRLYEENLKLRASLETLEYVASYVLENNLASFLNRKAYNTVVRGNDKSCNADAHVVDKTHSVAEKDVKVLDTSPLNVDDYPKVRYWFKDEYRKEKARRDAADKKNAKPTKKNGSFWFIENAEGIKIDNLTLSRMRTEAKSIWNEMCDNHGNIGYPWSCVVPKRRSEFLAKMENMYPFLRLCADHYKTTAVGTTDYSRWYKSRYPVVENTRKRARASTRSPRKSQRRRTSSRRATKQRVEEDDEEMEDASEDEEVEEDEEDEYVGEEDEEADEQALEEDDNDGRSDEDELFAEDGNKGKERAMGGNKMNVDHEDLVEHERSPISTSNTVALAFRDIVRPQVLSFLCFITTTSAPQPRTSKKKPTATGIRRTTMRLPPNAKNRPPIRTCYLKTQVFRVPDRKR